VIKSLATILHPKTISSRGLAPLLLSALVAIMMAASIGFSHNNGWSSPQIGDALIGLGIWILLYLIFMAILHCLDRCQAPVATRRFSARRIIIRALIIFASWLPILLLVYPGILFNDTIIQLAQWMGEPMYGYSSITAEASYSDHHPIFLMVIYGLTVQAGWAIFGDPNAGLFCLVIAESVLTAVSYAIALNYLERIGTPKMLVRVLFILWCAFPLFGWFCAIPVKETAFAWLYILFIICVCEYGQMLRSTPKTIVATPPACAYKPNAGFATWRWRISFIIICLLMALSKKTGVYLVLLSCIILAIIYRRQLLTLLVAIALPALTIFLIFPRIIFPAFNVSPGTPVEMLGIFYQQTARYVLDYPDDVSESEQQVIDEMFGFSTIKERYNPRNIDPLKGFGFLKGVEAWPNSEQVSRYLQVYLAQGTRHPDAYMRALGSLWSPWFYPQSYAQASVFYLSENWIEHAAWPPDTIPHYDRPEALKPITLLFIKAELFIAMMPPLVPLYVPVFYLLLLPAFCWCLLLLARRRRKLNARSCHADADRSNPGVRSSAFIVVPIVALGLLLLSPKTGIDVESMRYAIPFICSAPLLLGLAVSSYSGSYSDSGSGSDSGSESGSGSDSGSSTVPATTLQALGEEQRETYGGKKSGYNPEADDDLYLT
jgi:hypothetical protein